MSSKSLLSFVIYGFFLLSPCNSLKDNADEETRAYFHTLKINSLPSTEVCKESSKGIIVLDSKIKHMTSFFLLRTITVKDIVEREDGPWYVLKVIALCFSSQRGFIIPKISTQVRSMQSTQNINCSSIILQRNPPSRQTSSGLNYSGPAFNELDQQCWAHEE